VALLELLVSQYTSLREGKQEKPGERQKSNALSGIVEDWTENYFTESLRKDERAKSETSLQINALSLAPDMKVSLIPPLYFPSVYSSPVNYFSLLILVCDKLKYFRNTEFSVALIC
jgi:hypothetical protein